MAENFMSAKEVPTFIRELLPANYMRENRGCVHNITIPRFPHLKFSFTRGKKQYNKTRYNLVLLCEPTYLIQFAQLSNRLKAELDETCYFNIRPTSTTLAFLVDETERDGTFYLAEVILENAYAEIFAFELLGGDDLTPRLN